MTVVKNAGVFMCEIRESIEGGEERPSAGRLKIISRDKDFQVVFYVS